MKGSQIGASLSSVLVPLSPHFPRPSLSLSLFPTTPPPSRLHPLGFRLERHGAGIVHSGDDGRRRRRHLLGNEHTTAQLDDVTNRLSTETLEPHTHFVHACGVHWDGSHTSRWVGWARQDLSGNGLRGGACVCDRLQCAKSQHCCRMYHTLLLTVGGACACVWTGHPRAAFALCLARHTSISAACCAFGVWFRSWGCGAAAER